ncbi:MAG: phosphoglucomutase/phosphomannomutase PgmG [Alphaproteobacteria bacterium]
MSYTFDPTILREYDIRGQIGKNLSEKDAYALGRAFATFVSGEANTATPTICVGYDGRNSSPALSSSLIKGLRDSGANVVAVGLGPTPMLYFSVKHLSADAGVMVTGSHNPPDYNGFKMGLNKSPVFGETIQKIGKISESGTLNTGNGSLTEKDIKNEYVNRLMQDLGPLRDLSIAWDAGNGAAGEILQMLTAKIPGEHHLIFEDIDGNFPNHHPDPTVDENLVDLQKLVADHKCDLGIAFDGDGDRIGVVDENGDVLRCDILMTIYAREVIKNNPGAAIIGDVKCSSVMFDEINKMGGKGIMWKTGHSLIKDKMRELNAPLAGELSGHIFFADKYYGFDDALYCSVRLLNELSKNDGGLSSLTAHLPKLFNTPEVRFEVDEAEKFNLVPRVLESLKAQANEDSALDDIDGVRVTTSDGWWLLRPSNTQDVLVARVEASSIEGLDRLKKMASDEVKKLGYSIEF